MIINITRKAYKDLLYWKDTNPKIYTRIKALIEDIERQPSIGIGKPEQLKGNLTGYLSRRINRMHRLVYKINTNEIVIISCKYHYL